MKFWFFLVDIERVTTETAMTGTKMNDLSKPGTILPYLSNILLS